MLALASLGWAEPLRLHPKNSHYFLFRGKPTVLITSGEHYGALMNRDFDYKKYLDELARNHLNLTRTWTGTYREVVGNFSIANNTLAPAPDRFIAPWPRSDSPGALDGGNRFDLTKWNTAYFDRLKAFLREAGRRGIVVEITLFCPYYEESMWAVSPLNPKNSVNGVEEMPRSEALTMRHPALVAIEDALVKKLVSELRDFDNLYYEICNEPYFGGVTLDWQRHISSLIADAEKDSAHHLISQNIANFSAIVNDPDPHVSLLNFHYARPPEAVEVNYETERAIGQNETGFDGQSDDTYRIQGWDFLVAGGALYNNLDYSFTVGHEDGTFRYADRTPGGGSATLRKQLSFLRDFFDGLDVVSMSPAAALVRAGTPSGASVRALAAPGKSYVVYLHHGHVQKDAKPQFAVDAQSHRASLVLDLPPGRYRAEWLDTKTGSIAKSETLDHAGGSRAVASPTYTKDIVLRISAATGG